MRTVKQRVRQEFRENGRYAKVNPCYACDKSAGEPYFSHPLTDCTGSDGESFGDVAICLCKRCADETQEMTTVKEFLAYRKRRMPKGAL